MKVTLLGTRGSVGRGGQDTVGYGGDTACVEVVGRDGSLLLLDAGSGLLQATARVPADIERIDILLTHLHMDHIQGLGFFPPLRSPDVETHIWGPISTTLGLAERVARYMSPPLFPVRVRDLINTEMHDLGPGSVRVQGFGVTADLICHPGPTLGYRLQEDRSGTLAYLPDHEPALGKHEFPDDREWTSGADLVSGVDLLIHDSQYTAREYAERVGWGHSTLRHAVDLASELEVGHLVTFHHDPEHSDAELDDLHSAVLGEASPSCQVTPGRAGTVLEL